MRKFILSILSVCGLFLLVSSTVIVMDHLKTRAMADEAVVVPPAAKSKVKIILEVEGEAGEVGDFLRAVQPALEALDSRAMSGVSYPRPEIGPPGGPSQ